MDFHSTDSGHLDAGSDREVVFCHQCEHEWYRNEREDNLGPDNLSCPNCQGEITEIVELGNDPRVMNDDSSMSDSDHHHHHHLRHYPDTDSDPEEADIDDLSHEFPGGRGFFRRNVFRSSASHNPGHHRPTTHPENGEDIINRFNEMLQDINGPGLVGRSGPDTLFATGPRHVTYQRISGPGFTGGFSSFTITTGGGGGGNRGPPRMGGMDDPFQSIFQNILGNVGPPPMDRDREADPDDPDEPNRTPDIRNALNQFVANLLNPHAAHGDAVYTQEALDRIITNLMEANPQSNAAAPATDNAIKNLPKKKLDEEMLGPELKGECTICIDEMTLGEEVLILPCKHWFHEECVVLWLKQHNTCPICRSPIEGEQAGRPAAPEPSASEAGPSTREPATSSSTAGEQRRWNLRNQREARLGTIRDMAGSSSWRTSSRRDSNSPQRQPATQSPRVRSPSNAGRRSPDEQPTRDRASSSGGPFQWLRRLGGERRS